jgi:hypothetical protein
VGALFCAAACAGFAGWWKLSGTAGSPAARAPGGGTGGSRPLVILISGDTAGWIAPCGCATNQSGGLLRRGTFVAEQRTQAEVILADAGGAAGGTSLYDRLKFASLLQGELAMGVAVHNIGRSEIAQGLDELRRLALELRVPFISANLRDGQGQPVVDGFRIIEAGGTRTLFVGVVSPRYATGECRISEPVAAVLETLQSQQGHFDRVVVLAYLPEDEVRALAAAVPESHAVVGGPTGQCIAPVAAGPVLLASATNKGKFMVRLTAGSAGSHNPLSGDIVEMDGSISDDATQQKLLAEFRRDLAARDLSAADSGLAPAATARIPADSHIAGSASCAACHEEDGGHWRASAHARAWETLVHAEAQADSYCQQCHTTGFGIAGGFVSAGRVADRGGVGCESCHGPSAAHAARPALKTPFTARDQCVTCHDHENSPKFEYASYWEKILHGAQGARTK